MWTTREKTELAFQRLALLLYKNPFKVLFVVCAFIGALVFQIPKITIDTSSEAMLYDDDPAIVEYINFKEQFGHDDVIFIAVRSQDIFTEQFLKKLKSFHHDLKTQVPYVNKVTSLINVRNIYGSGDSLVVEELLDNWPEKKVDLQKLKEDVLNNSFLKNHIVSEAGRLTVLLISTSLPHVVDYGEDDLFRDLADDTAYPKEDSGKLTYLTAREYGEVIDAIHRVIDHHKGAGFLIALSGIRVLTDAYNHAIKKDLVFLSVIGFLTVVFFLWLLFRRISGLFLPGVIIISSLFSVFGVMAIIGMPVTIVTGMLPSFLLAVGVADSVHILSIFYRCLGKGDSKEKAVIFSMGHSGFPVVLTSLTTATGLLSFTFAELTIIAQLGIYASLGVLFALVYTIFMLPALLAIMPVKETQAKSEKRQMQLMDNVLLSFADFSTSQPIKILTVSFVIFVVSVFFVLQLEFGFNLANFFPDTRAVKQDLLLIDRELKGIMALEIVVDAKQPDSIKDPLMLSRIERFCSIIKNYEFNDISVGKVFSISDIIKEINQALHENDPDFLEIPSDKSVVSQELFLFQNSGAKELERIVDSNFSKTRITIRTPWTDATIFENFIKTIQKVSKDIFQDSADIRITGLMAITTRALNAAVHSMGKGYLYAFLAITLIMIILVGNIKLGLISMIPNVLPILLVMGIVGCMGIPLDIVTMLIGCVAIGLVVDDTMHFIYNFQKYFGQTLNSRKAVQQTMTSTGRALFITSMILSACFFVSMLGSMKSVVRFGLLAGITVVLALVADFVVAPALMVIAMKKKERV